MLSETAEKRVTVRRSLIKLLKSFKLYSSVRAMRLWMTHANLRAAYHHRHTVEFYSQFIRKGDLCFDVGANVGKFTSAFLELGAKVVCVEPQDVCLKQLYKSFGVNRGVIIVGKAVGEHEGYGELLICEEAPTISTMSDRWTNEGRFSKNYKWTKTRKVPVTTLDALIQTYGRPKYCKIDVEGFEEPALKGLTKPVPLLSFEFTREFFDDAKKCIDHLLSIGRVKFNCSLGESMQFLFQKWVTPDELYKRMDEGKLLWGDIYARFQVPEK
jgi:FkbM family methyltransferase